jgi:hypothetical protein
MVWKPREVRSVSKVSASVKATLGKRALPIAEAVAGTMGAFVKTGFVEIELDDTKTKKVVARLYLDPKRLRGVVYRAEMGVFGWMKAGQFLPFAGVKEPQLAAALRSIGKSAPPAAAGPVLVAKGARTVSSRADVTKLEKVERAQLVAAARALCGKLGLPALLAQCDAWASGLELVTVSDASGPRFDAWLTSAAEDGVFFEHGKTKPSGLAISQGGVSDQTARRTELALSIERAMKKLRLGRSKPWRG